MATSVALGPAVVHPFFGMVEPGSISRRDSWTPEISGTPVPLNCQPGATDLPQPGCIKLPILCGLDGCG